MTIVAWAQMIIYGTMITVITVPATTIADAQKIEVTCGVGAGDRLSARDIIIKCGPSDDELQALVQSAADQAVAQVRQDPDQGLKDLSRELAKELGVTEDAINKFFDILGR